MANGARVSSREGVMLNAGIPPTLSEALVADTRHVGDDAVDFDAMRTLGDIARYQRWSLLSQAANASRPGDKIMRRPWMIAAPRSVRM
jgi:hypothetical protein